MKLLLIGPYPPPHGGISVHVTETKKYLEQAGVEVRVLNTDRRAALNQESLGFRSTSDLILILLRHARGGWTLHLHTNGHNPKSWGMACICGLAGMFAPASLLTLHSGMTPAFLNQGSLWRRSFAWFVCELYDRVIAVNSHILDALAGLGIPEHRMEMLPAYLPASPPAELPVHLDASIGAGIRDRWPVLTTVLFFRPEYGFELLTQALARLRTTYPKLVCLVMGSGEQQKEAQQRIREEGIQDAVVLLGDVPHELCLALISGSDVFVRATLEDGDSISVREALSFGVPTVASDVGNRPAGALRFRAGDLEDLISKIETVLNESGRNLNRGKTPAIANGFQRLKEIYQNSMFEGAQG